MPLIGRKFLRGILRSSQVIEDAARQAIQGEISPRVTVGRERTTEQSTRARGNSSASTPRGWATEVKHPPGDGDEDAIGAADEAVIDVGVTIPNAIPIPRFLAAAIKESYETKPAAPCLLTIDAIKARADEDDTGQ